MRSVIVMAALAASAAPAVCETASPAYDWTGFYAGVIGGYRELSSDSRAYKGAMGGLTIGYNAQISRLVIGIEADAAFGEIGRKKAAPDSIVGNNIEPYSRAIGSFDLRIGLAFDRFLIYAKSGLSAADNRFSYVGTASVFVPGGFFTPVAISGSENRNHLGWNAGAGAEIGLGDGWSVKGEYSFTRLFEQHYFRSFPIGLFSNPFVYYNSGPIDYQTAKVGINYRFAL